MSTSRSATQSQLKQFNVVREILIAAAVKEATELPAGATDEQRRAIEPLTSCGRASLDNLGLDSSDTGLAAAQWKRAIALTLAPGPPSRAHLRALADIFRMGPVRLTRTPRRLFGFHPRRLEGPPSLRGAVFLGLAERGWLRLVDGDPIEALWDLSPSGIDALRRHDQRFASIDARFVDGRLARAKNEFEISEGVTLQGPLAMPVPHTVVRRIGREPGRDESAALVELRAGVRFSATESLADRIRARAVAKERVVSRPEGRLAEVINEMLGFAYAYLDVIEGCARVDLRVLVDDGVAIAGWQILPTSWDSTASSDDERALYDLTGQAEGFAPTAWAKATLEFRIVKTRKDGVRRFWVGPRFEIASLADAIHAAGQELRPSGVRMGSKLELVFCGRRPAPGARRGDGAPARLLHWGWHDAETRHGNYRHIRFPRALLGRNAVRMSRLSAELARRWCATHRASVTHAWTVNFEIAFDVERWRCER